MAANRAVVELLARLEARSIDVVELHVQRASLEDVFLALTVRIQTERMRRHILISLRLYFRNKMALIYGYLFPTIFLVAFWVLYRYEKVPLARHWASF